MPPPRKQVSPPFASRELNGETLLEELDSLREAQVGQKHLNDCAVALRQLNGVRVSEAAARIRQLATGRFAGQPALASLLVRWAARLKSEVDVPLFSSHIERLALTSALIAAMRRGADRLRGGRP
ncbi:MAG: hypothetical protein HYZ28_22640 [Myxococcales bacterium]|nr:hypothetical protein [Myxococcales bacterium]